MANVAVRAVRHWIELGLQVSLFKTGELSSSEILFFAV
jgi:hypothetical protein